MAAPLVRSRSSEVVTLHKLMVSVLIPAFLKNVKEQYVVMGGRAFDAYFSVKDIDRSVDWDIFATDIGFVDKIRDFLAKNGYELSEKQVPFEIPSLHTMYSIGCKEFLENF